MRIYKYTYLQICTDICGFAHIYIYTYIHTYLPIYIHTYLPTYLPTYIHTYMHTCKYLHAHTYMYIYICAHRYMFAYTHMYIYIYHPSLLLFHLVEFLSSVLLRSVGTSCDKDMNSTERISPRRPWH